MCYEKGGEGGDESLNKGNRLFLKNWPSSSIKSKLR